MFTWAQKKKLGTAKPLPCEECSCFFSRCVIHLKGYHNYNHENAKTTVTNTCKILVWHNWWSERKRGNFKFQYIKLCFYQFKSNNCETEKERGIENDGFHITYENGGDLLDVFHEEISCKKSIMTNILQITGTILSIFGQLLILIKSYYQLVHRAIQY